MTRTLKDFIDQIRNCKTACEERDIAAKELADIRTCIRAGEWKASNRIKRRGNPPPWRSSNRSEIVSKLVFLHMLGYSTHFAQLSIIHLVASSSSSSSNSRTKNLLQEKRMGYLGLLILVGDISDLLLLVTNSLKQDLQAWTNCNNASNRLIVGLALTAVGTLATPDMARNLAPEVRKLLLGYGSSSSSSLYLHKKALLAMARCINQAPDTMDYFFSVSSNNNHHKCSPDTDNHIILTLLSDANYGVLLAALHMIRTMIIQGSNSQYDEREHYLNLKSMFVSLVPTLVNLLEKSSLLMTSIGDTPNRTEDYVAIPFVQVQILSLLRLIFCDDDTSTNVTSPIEIPEVVQQGLNDLLTLSKDCGTYAVLYECIVTIVRLQRCEEKLQQVAITTILSHFLQNEDPNIVYVGLETLSSSTIFSRSSEMVVRDLLQQHRHTIVNCMKDPDISIRKRALHLMHRMVDATCIDSIAFELLNNLSMSWSSSNHREEICTHLLSLINRYPKYDDDCWKVDVLLSMLSIAGGHCTEKMQWDIIGHIYMASKDLRCYTVHRLVKILRQNEEDCTNHGLRYVTIWCIGEYSDLLLHPYSYNSPSSKGSVAKVFLSELDVTISVTFLGLEPNNILHAVETVISNPTTCPERLHQVAITSLAKMYYSLKDTTTKSDFERVRERICHLLGRYGTSHSLELQSRSCELLSWILYDSKIPHCSAEMTPIPFIQNGKTFPRVPIIPLENSKLPSFFNPEEGPADLLDLNFEECAITTTEAPFANQKTVTTMESRTKNSIIPCTEREGKMIYSRIAENSPTVVVNAFSDQVGLNVYLECSKPLPRIEPKRSDILIKIENMDVFFIPNLAVQVAVPSFITMQIFPPSSTSLPASQVGNTQDHPLITQKLSVVNTLLGIKMLKLKVKITYWCNGYFKEILETITSFPEGY